MCARFENKTKPEKLVELFDLTTLPSSNFPEGDIRPTDRAILITDKGATVQPWGIPSPWDAKPLINARSETLSEKQTFRPLLLPDTRNRLLRMAQARQPKAEKPD